MDNGRRAFYRIPGMLAIAFLVSSSCTFVAGCGPGSFDMVITGGVIHDGTQNKPYAADIGINGDKIAAIGDLSKATAKKTLDATGLIVTPGFIDVHNHSEFPFRYGGTLEQASQVPDWKGNYPFISQGVTTVVTGNCGLGYTDTRKWLEMVDELGFGTNVYTLAPHGEIRLEVFGKDQPGKLTPEQLDKLKKRFEEEMEKGAMGFSTGLEYAPGELTSTEELIEIAKVVDEYGGVYATHARDLTGTICENGQPGILESIREAIEIGRESGIPVQISHIQVNAPWDDAEASQLLSLIEDAREEGIDVTADQHPYNRGMARLTIHIPSKYSKSSTQIKDEYKTGEGREELLKEAEKSLEAVPPDKMTVTLFPQNPEYVGKTIMEIAEEEGKSPAEVFVDLLCQGDAPAILAEDQKEDIVRNLMPREYVFTASDGWWFEKGGREHPRSYGAFPRKIRKYVLEENVMSLDPAIRSMTSLPAEKFGMRGRGRIAKGYYADIAVIDLDNYTDRATYDDPSEYSEGVKDLLVNGVIEIENGEFTGKTGGRALKRND